ELLGAPDPKIFLQLIDEGAITIDHLISKKYGDRSATEKGPLFKIRGDARDQLYSSVERFDLLVI
ncbi:MvaI/BcnI family restriction endonuclease, partial [Luminiphilus sp.]|nr:MvaI/BcnI family restriction endonuclease [Luminiphilus sp.]